MFGLFLSFPVAAQHLETPLAELLLSARTVDDRAIDPSADGVYQARVGKPFDLEISYDDFRAPDQRLGIFRLRTDLLFSQGGILEPVLKETQKIYFGGEIRDVPLDGRGPITFRQQHSGTEYVTSYNALAANPFREVSNALQQFGYSPNQFELSSPDRLSDSDVGIQIRYLDDELADRDLPNIFVETDFSIPVPVEFVEVLPRNADGTINHEALVLNLDTHSRTFNENQRFYHSNDSGSFDLASGFFNVGGIGGIPSNGGGIPQLTSDGEFVTPFDAFSIRVQFLSAVANFVIDLKPSSDSESILMYGEDNGIPIDRIVTDQDARLIFNVVPEPSGLLLSATGVWILLVRRNRRRGFACSDVLSSCNREIKFR
jgi:hypothetical protein